MKIGFIGAGNMAEAIIAGILKKEMVLSKDIIAYDTLEQRLEQMVGKYQISKATDAKALTRECDFIFLAIKPIFYQEVIESIKDEVRSQPDVENIKDKVGKQQVIISLAPGKSLAWLGGFLGENRKIVRSMPNTPALVGEGMTGVCFNEHVSQAEQEQVMMLFHAIGKAEIVPERLMDAVVAVSGSAPAYVFMFIEAMADAAVAEGMPREQAYRFAAQAVYGSAKMVLDTNQHPGELKDMVCSPGGTTIEAVAEFEAGGFRSAVIKAMKKCAEKSRKM